VSARTVDASFDAPWTAPVPLGSVRTEKDGTFRIAMQRREERRIRVVLPEALRAAPDLLVECVAATWRDGPFPCEVSADTPAATNAPRAPVVVVRGVPPGLRIDAAVRVRSGACGHARRRRVGVRDRGGRGAHPGGRPVRGRVLHSGTPVVGALVEIRGPDRDRPGDFAVSGPTAASRWPGSTGWWSGRSPRRLRGWLAGRGAARVPAPYASNSWTCLRTAGETGRRAASQRRTASSLRVPHRGDRHVAGGVVDSSRRGIAIGRSACAARREPVTPRRPGRSSRCAEEFNG